MIYLVKNDTWLILPTIGFNKRGKTVTIMLGWLNIYCEIILKRERNEF